jgi:hypothetical protein
VNPYHQSITLSPDAFRLSPEEEERYQEMLRQSEAIGRSARLYLRKIARATEG